MKPVFIIGCERSGTTMLGAALGTLDHVVCLPESPFIGENVLAPVRTRVDREAVARRFERHSKYRAWREAGCRTLDAGNAPACGYPGFVRHAVSRYAEAVQNHDPRWWVEHSPVNVLRIDRLIATFDGAKVVHIVRDGRAVAASLLAVDWGPNDAKTAALLWSARVGAGLAAEDRFGPAIVHRVRYEALVQQPDHALASVCEFAGIPLRRTMGNAFRVPSYARPTHRLVGQPMDRTRVEAWRRTLTSRQVEIFEATAGSLLACLGYERAVGGREPRPQAIHESAALLVLGAAKALVNEGRRRLR